MKRTALIVMSCLGTLAFANLEEKPEKNYTAECFPENTNLGMTCEEVQNVRPEAKKLDLSLSSGRTNVFIMTELMKDALPAICYQYQFIDNKLRAVTKGILHARKWDDKSVKQIHEALEKDLVKQNDEKIVRLDDKMKQVSVTAELWKDKKKEINVYFVDTSKDTTIITFDPKYFTDKDFFITPERAPLISPVLENLRKTVETLKKYKQK